jgi:hypothetical protein
MDLFKLTRQEKKALALLLLVVTLSLLGWAVF